MVFLFALSFSQITNIADGESISLRIHYGFLNAGTANLTARKTTYRGTPHLYVKGTGQTTGAVRAFFKVDDLYESYINMNTELPSFYVRNVKDGELSLALAVTASTDCGIVGICSSSLGLCL